MPKLNRIFRKSVCSLISAAMFMLPGWSLGGETNMGAIGRQAQDFAESLGADAIPGSISMDGSSVTIPLGNGKTQTIDQSEFSPETLGDSNYGYGSSPSEIDALRGIYDEASEMDSRGAAAKKDLYADSLQDDPSTLEGNVYKVLTHMYYEIERPDMSDDSMFDTTNDILGNLEDIVAGLGDCSADTVLNEVTSKKHVPDYRTCNKVLDRSGTCTLHHYYNAGIIQHYDGPYNIEPCGPGCTDVYIGDKSYQTGAHRWSDGLYVEQMRFTVRNPDAIVKAELDFALWEDHMQIWFGPDGREQKVYQGPRADCFPYTDEGGYRGTTRNPSCWRSYDLHQVWNPFNRDWDRRICSVVHGCEAAANQGRPVDVTNMLKAAPPNAVFTIAIRTAVLGAGEGFARMRISYDSTETIYEEEWSPPECVEALQAVGDGFADGTYKCTKMPTLNAEGCTQMNGIIVCPDDMVQPPRTDINPLCQEMEFTSDWDFYQGKLDCWIDANGNKQCPENVGGNLDDCKTYEEDPKCSFVKSECVDGAQGASGTCYVTEMTYDCGEDVEVTDTEAETTYECPGDIACMGNECIDTTHGVSNSFAQVTALMNAMQYMTQDMECTGIEDEEDKNITCTVFGGEPGECKKAVGGMQNCCEPVPGIGLNEYIHLVKVTAKVNSAANSIAETGSMAGTIAGDLAGQWVSLKGEAASVIKEGLSWISDDFASAFDNIGGFVTDVFGDSTSEGMISALENQLKDYAKELLTDLFKEMGLPVAEGAGATTASGAATMIVEGAAMVFAVVSWIYTAYVVANLIVQLIYSCETEEYEMISQKQLGNCHKVGSYCKSKVLGMCIEKREVYCCFKSPLARIMNEQIRLQGDVLGVEFDGWGEPKNPKCSGIPLDRVGEVDWDRVDLSEWIAMLEATGNMPDDDSISIDKLTGKGSALDMTGDRLNTIDRTLERLDEIDVDGVRSEANDAIDLDTGYVPAGAAAP